ncbi:MAG: RloB domain-containing protein [Acetobacter sp.]|nr:RloB domain-containing protein [Acetobacter sp.]
MIQERSFERNKPSKRKLPTIFIATEGQTEESYFNEARKKYRGITVRIKCHKHKTAPDQIMKLAASESKNYDFLFAVFDCDNHETYKKARDFCTHHPKVIVIRSTPCFELWLLLHFTKITYNQNINNDKVIELLKYPNRLPDYDKSNKRVSKVFEKTKEHLNTAIKHAKYLNQNEHNSDLPYTNVHNLFNHFESIKNEKDKWLNKNT